MVVGLLWRSRPKNRNGLDNNLVAIIMPIRQRPSCRAGSIRDLYDHHGEGDKLVLPKTFGLI